MNHAVSQLVTCLKNGQMARKEKVITPSSKLKLSILGILKKDGFIYNLDKYEKVLNDRLFPSVRRMRQLVKRG